MSYPNRQIKIKLAVELDRFYGLENLILRQVKIENEACSTEKQAPSELFYIEPSIK